jgi:hypothetical protein
MLEGWMEGCMRGCIIRYFTLAERALSPPRCTYFECELPCDTVSDCYDVRTAAPLAIGGGVI